MASVDNHLGHALPFILRTDVGQLETLGAGKPVVYRVDAGRMGMAGNSHPVSS
jgi:hypothetical protein